MPDLLVTDVPAEIAEAPLSHRDLWEEAARLRAEIGRLDGDTTEIIRFYRDTR